MADRIEPISHIEKVITGTAEPISHLEWIIATYGGGSGSGSSGTTNYDALTNKPSINGITLTGNKTSIDLGMNFIIPSTEPTNKVVGSIWLI